jgi:hypothetical protein
MTERNHKAENQSPEGEHEGLDCDLNAALAKYASAEPRVGLEARILATVRAKVRAESQPFLDRGFWRSSTAAMTAALAMALILIVAWSLWPKSGRPEPDHTARQPSQRPAETRRPAETMTVEIRRPRVSTGEGSEDRPHRSPVQPVPTVRSEVRTARVAPVGRTQPKLDQFPSPRPLSEQEQFLVSYVARDPETAALVAEARAEARQRDLEEEADEAAKSSMR